MPVYALFAVTFLAGLGFGFLLGVNHKLRWDRIKAPKE